MQANLEMALWRILSGGRLLEWEYVILQETNLLRRGAWVRQELQRATFVEACLDNMLV
jgi:predicted RNA-binding protein YlxR (DUF448 family)